MDSFDEKSLPAGRQEKIRISLIYNSAIFIILRGLVLALIILFGLYQMSVGALPKIPLSLLSFFAIFEIFIKFEIQKIKPVSEISQNTHDITDSFTKQALESVLYKNSTKEFINYIQRFPQTKFFLEKAVIAKKELGSEGVSSSELSKKHMRLHKN